MSGTFRNDISTTGFFESKKIGKIAGALEALPLPSAEFEGITIQYLGEKTAELRQYNTYLCQKQADGTYAWVDNSPAGGGVWGKIEGTITNQDDLIRRIKALINDSATGEEPEIYTWSAGKLKTEFGALAGTVNVVVVDAQPTIEAATAKTIYYCGTSAPYHIYLCAYNAATPPVKSWYDMGTSEVSFENYFTKTEVTEKITGEATDRRNNDELLQLNIDKKQNKVIYGGSVAPSPTVGAIGDLYIKDSDDSIWSKVAPENIISDGTKEGDKTWSSNKLDLTFYDKTAVDGKVDAKQNKVLTGTVPPTPSIGVEGDLYINYGADQHWISVDLDQVIDDAVTSGNKTWSSNELNARFRALASSVKVEIVPTKPTTGVLNTTYYVGTGSPYHVWLYSNNSAGVATWFDLGTTSIDFSNYYTKAEANSTFIKTSGCTVPVGGIYVTMDTADPSTKWAGTSWTALPDIKEWDEVNETVLANPAGVTGVVAYSVHCNVVTVKFDAVKCAEPVHNYFYNIPTKYNPNANQLCVVLNAWDDLTTKTFACVNTALSGGNIYLRKITDTDNTQYGFISYPCGGGTPDRVYKRYKRTL